jgi:hypothetical protein
MKLKIRLFLLLLLPIIYSQCKKNADNVAPSNQLHVSSTTSVTYYDTLNVQFRGKHYSETDTAYMSVGTWGPLEDDDALFNNSNTTALLSFELNDDSAYLAQMKLDTLHLTIGSENITNLSFGFPYSVYFSLQDSIQYGTFHQVNIRPNAANYCNITSLTYKGRQLYNFGGNYVYRPLWEIKGNFNFILYNYKNSMDSAAAQGTFTKFFISNP